MKDDFYSQFEHAFRGERPEIKERLQVYVPLIEPLIDLYPDALALDLGCGRGEWLEVLRDKGLNAKGVDLDDGMLAECRKLNLNVSTQDVIAALNSFEDESISMVSAFHLVEHISFEMLRALISEAFRVLKPGGLLILETPNPENILVGTSTFYLDPTHTRPIPPGLLKFLSKYYGFVNGTVLGLQESPALREKVSPSLRDVLGGASPDYAVVAQKPAHENIIARFKPAFSLERGLTTDALMTRYDQRIQAIAALGAQNQQKHAELTQAISALNAQIHAVYHSSSWKVTRPLRAMGSALRHAKEWLKRNR
jgi:SAM-dependent methyltransferase